MDADSFLSFSEYQHIINQTDSYEQLIAALNFIEAHDIALLAVANVVYNSLDYQNMVIQFDLNVSSSDRGSSGSSSSSGSDSRGSRSEGSHQEPITQHTAVEVHYSNCASSESDSQASCKIQDTAEASAGGNLHSESQELEMEGEQFMSQSNMYHLPPVPEKHSESWSSDDTSESPAATAIEIAIRKNRESWEHLNTC